MCNFYSCIVDRNLKLYDAIDKDNSHETVIDTHKLKDNKLKDRDIVRLEITPDVEKLTKTFNKSHWSFKVDEEGTLPKWFSSKEERIKKMVFDKLHDDIWGKYILVGKEIDKSTNRIVLCKNAVINNLHHEVGVMRGSSQVGVMWDSSQVRVMRESSQVGVMRGSSQVREMRGSSQVREMRESSQVGVMRESSQVGVMWDSSQVGVMRDSSQVGVMWESSQVREMWGSSQVREMWGSSLITRYSPDVKILKQSDGNTVIIDRSGDKVKVKIG